MILIAFLSVIFSAQQTGPPREVQKVSLEARLQEALGANPLDCGRHGRAANDEEAMKKSLKCGLDAALSGKPFHIIRDEQGIDSQVAYGLLAKADGRILSFTYDSAPCGGPGCASLFQTKACPLPEVSADPRDRRFQFVCK